MLRPLSVNSDWQRFGLKQPVLLLTNEITQICQSCSVTVLFVVTGLLATRGKRRILMQPFTKFNRERRPAEAPETYRRKVLVLVGVIRLVTVAVIVGFCGE